MSKTMVSPVRGYTTSEFGRRGIGTHLGLDMGTGGTRAPVYASFDGIFDKIVRGRAHGQPSVSGPTLAPGRSGNGSLILNPDGERQLYGHVLTLSGWKEGESVKAGQLLGYVDLSGNTSGYHLHFEIWNAARVARNPRIDFDYFNVVPGSAPRKYVEPREYPDIKMSEKNTIVEIRNGYDIMLKGVGWDIPKNKPNNANTRIQLWLQHQGYYKGRIDGKDGPMQKGALQQRLREAERRPYTGPIDRVWGGMGSDFRISASAFLNDRIDFALRA